jgi:hypothetical protein
LEDAGFKVKEGKNNCGTYAVLGQLINQILYKWKDKPRRNLFIRAFVRYCAKSVVWFGNTLFPLLDDRSKDERYTLNYIFVGEK